MRVDEGAAVRPLAWRVAHGQGVMQHVLAAVLALAMAFALLLMPPRPMARIGICRWSRPPG